MATLSSELVHEQMEAARACRLREDMLEYCPNHGIKTLGLERRLIECEVEGGLLRFSHALEVGH